MRLAFGYKYIYFKNSVYDLGGSICLQYKCVVAFKN